MRLTRHFKDRESVEMYDIRDISKELDKNFKLSQLEDIEEELGIDFETLFRALQYPIYVKEKDQTWWCSNRLFFAFHEAFIVITYWKGKKKEDITLLLRDYGKTWALTREELQDVSHN